MPVSQSFALAHTASAQAAPNAPALVFPDQTLSHLQLCRLGQAFAQRMRQAGVERGTRVQLKTPDPTLLLAVLLGTSWLGAQFVPFSGEGSTPDAIKPSHVLFDPRQREAPNEGAVVIDTEWSPACTPEFDASLAPNCDAPWLWVHTTGTTGNPKFLSLSQEMVVARSLAVSDEFRSDSRHVLLAHCYSRPFLARAAAALINGSSLYFDLSPKDWHGAGISMISGSRALINTVLGETVLSPRVARLELAGSRLPDHEAINLLKSFQIVDDTYGASETSKTYSGLWQDDDLGQPFVVGKARDSDVEIIGADEKPVPVGERGIVRIHNPYMCAGYLNDAKASADSFRDGWFYPGDVAWLDDKRRLHIANRTDHVVNIMGNKVNAFAIDQVLRATKGIKDAICFRNPKSGAIDELFAFIVFEEGANRLQAVVTGKIAISKRFGDEMIPRVMQPVAVVPRKSDGEPDRQACADMVIKVAANRQGQASE